MKALILVSTLGLTLLANTAIASQSSVWRNIEVNTSDVVVEDVKNNNWRSTQFNPVEKANKETKSSKIWRKIKM